MTTIIMVVSLAFLIGLLIGVFGTFAVEAPAIAKQLNEYVDNIRGKIATFEDAIATIDKEILTIMIKDKVTEEDKFRLRSLEEALKVLTEEYERIQRNV